jgi:NAD(P)-dependent dehydrogenase (short-subunit alcohol dehydrogenase family)
MLRNKVAIVHGAGASVGGAVARAFARNGAHVVLSGRHSAKLETVLADMRLGGRTGAVAIADALHKDEVDEAVATVHAQHGRLCGSFNLIGPGRRPCHRFQRRGGTAPAAGAQPASRFDAEPKPDSLPHLRRVRDSCAAPISKLGSGLTPRSCEEVR